MLILLSPAKSLDFAEPPPAVPRTQARLAEDLAALAGVTRSLSRADLRGLMDISEALAELNHARFQAFDPRHGAQGKQAILAFDGDVYQGLDAASLSAEDLAFAQERLRILSGLYGLLRPLDAIQPYRLEMGTRLPTPRGRTLYAFWGDRIARALNEDLGPDGGPVINLASQEYFSAVDTRALDARVITPVFKEERNGQARIVSFFAKKARGMMARHAVVNRLSRPEDLQGFSAGGYRFQPEASSPDSWVFTRPHP